MIVCHRHRFIFIATRKTSGTRIETALARFCADGDIVTGSSDANGRVQARANGTIGPARYRPADWLRLMVRGRHRRLDKHLGAIRIREFVGAEVWGGYFKFCVERDPWEKAIALYGQRTRDSRTNKSTMVPGTGRKPRPTLAQFLADARRESLSNFDLYSIDGALAVDRVIRYEHLASELEAVRNLLSLPAPITLDSDPPLASHYSTAIGATERALIDAVCAREIELFGYAFSEVAPEDR